MAGTNQHAVAAGSELTCMNASFPSAAASQGKLWVAKETCAALQLSDVGSRDEKATAYMRSETASAGLTGLQHTRS